MLAPPILGEFSTRSGVVDAAAAMLLFPPQGLKSPAGRDNTQGAPLHVLHPWEPQKDCVPGGKNLQ